MLQPIIHYGLHFFFPILIARIFYPAIWKKATIVLWLTMLIDMDHILARPFFEACRCSIGFHPLHTIWAMAAYLCLLFFKRTRLVGIGLLFHLLTDQIDCWLSNYYCV
jgi:hypothetical protein